MKWIKITLNTTTEAVDFISGLFDELGLEGIQIEDCVPLSQEDKEAMFIDILPELPPDEGKATVTSYVSPERDLEELKARIAEGLEEISGFADVGEGTIATEVADDGDWLNNWKAFFKPFRVAEDIVIKPTWEALEGQREGDIVIEIDPGTAFGTGSHETTKLCIAALRNYVMPETLVLDVGCGSGILSIVGLKLGAKACVGTDIDPVAIKVTYENMEANHIPKEAFCVHAGNIIEDRQLQDKVGYGKYDLVVANILADVIIPLSGEIRQHMKPGGLFISSGIIAGKREEVKEALLENGFEIVEVNEMGDWLSFVAAP